MAASNVWVIDRPTEIVSCGLQYLENYGQETAVLKEELNIPDDFEDLAFD